ncbi:hypothetical protein RUMCAL_01709 [Ruminococcus callidus ATCC 27760]|uniref:Uncharacterized protein n=1 Tax=Ruminococcus callidus ATCC 27760 TaxID=411473 RepID=U2KSS0_9FIRM|nr:hypothetical protein RUMCAL_01709 [Ruminococcus callidus ATCC 27760]
MTIATKVHCRFCAVFLPCPEKPVKKYDFGEKYTIFPKTD